MADAVYRLQGEITATGLLKSVAGETPGAPNSIEAATPSNGTAQGDYVPPDDPRLSDARTPAAHKSSHSTGGDDALSPADIGAQPALTQQQLDNIAAVPDKADAAHTHAFSDVNGLTDALAAKQGDIGLSVVDGAVCMTFEEE